MNDATKSSAATHKPGRGRIYDSITETIGDTPIVRLDKIAKAEGVSAKLLAKLEFFNPIASVKDRIGVAMIEAMEKDGRIKPGETTLVEPTSGNTGIALAFAAAAKGYRLILVMPETMSDRAAQDAAPARRRAGADGGRQGHEGRHRQGGGDRRDRRRAPSSRSSSRTRPTRRSTAAPRRRRSGTTPAASVDVIVSGIGTGGTITGVGQVLKPRKPGLHIVAVEPADSPILSGGEPGPHKIQGIGAGFVPGVLDTKVYDEVVTVTNEEAFTYARLAARLEGVPVGISSGGAIAAAVKVGKRPEMAGKNIVIIIPSFAERYLSTALFEGLE